MSDAPKRETLETRPGGSETIEPDAPAPKKKPAKADNADQSAEVSDES